MAHRKLQQEIDRVFKKINEGLEIFDTYYERHEACTNNPPQKEKLESDLKREVKKLQRLREQIKSWQSSPEIKDKEALLDHRKSVEIAMEKYKAVEKASKEKAYSNISLKKSEILEPEEKERQEVSNYLLRQIDELEREYDLLQIEVDKLFMLNKKKKTHSIMNEQKLEETKALQSRLRWHQQQMELALRLLANEQLSPEKVYEIKDDIDFYVESNQQEGFVEDESIYDDLDLHSNELIAHEVSQSFAQKGDDDDDDDDDDMSSQAGSILLDSDAATSKLSKKELRKLEREAKKAAKLAAKNAATLSASQGPTISIKLDPTPKGASSERLLSSEISETRSPSPQVESPSKYKSNKVAKEKPVTSSQIQEQLNTIEFKPVPVRPAGDLKWSDAAALSMEKETKSVAAGSIISPDSQISSNTNTPRSGTPSLLSRTEKTNNIALESLNQTPSLYSAAAGAVLAAGAVAVNKNNQVFHRNSPHPSALDISASENVIVDQQEKLDLHNLPSLDKNIKEDVQEQEVQKESGYDNDDNDDNISLLSTFSYEDEDYDAQFLKPIIPFTEEQMETKAKKCKVLEDMYSTDFGTLKLPNGIKEFIMGYEIYNNDLCANDGKFGGYRRSVDLCNIERLHDVPLGVNPPNPLDAFRSSQQWDTIRCSIDTTDNDLKFDGIMENFRGLEMFSLFYNYYFAVTPLEKNLALSLLRERDWKVAIGETIWFLRQGEPKFKNENFEIGDFKIFKLDDWSVIEKINFKLDYANLKFNDINGQSDKLLNELSLNEAGKLVDDISHGRQLLQQLRLGKT